MRALKTLILFGVGGGIYFLIEYVWRCLTHSQSTHWTMFLVGGLAFLIVGGINEYLSWEMLLQIQILIGTLAILMIEFVSGCVLNLWLGLNIWDYSELPCNLLGQVCLPYAACWVVLSAVAILLDDFLRWQLFGEEKPHYKVR